MLYVIRDFQAYQCVGWTLRRLGVTHLDIPITPEKVWRILKEEGAAQQRGAFAAKRCRSRLRLGLSHGV